MIIIQYYNVLCAKFHLKKSFTKGSTTRYVLRVLDVQEKLNTVQGTKPTKLDDNASLHSTITCSRDYLFHVDTGPSYSVQPQTGLIKRDVNFTIHSHYKDGRFGGIATSFPNSIFFQVNGSHIIHKWFLSPNNLMLLVLIYVENVGGSTSLIPPPPGFSKLFPKANNIG